MALFLAAKTGGALSAHERAMASVSPELSVKPTAGHHGRMGSTLGTRSLAFAPKRLATPLGRLLNPASTRAPTTPAAGPDELAIAALRMSAPGRLPANATDR